MLSQARTESDAALERNDRRRPNRQFANPNATGPGPANGFGGERFVVPGTNFTVDLAPSTPSGTYQARVIGLSPTGQPVGTFSDAVTVVVVP